MTLISETQILWIVVPSLFCQLPMTTSGTKKGKKIGQRDFYWKYISLYVTWSYSLSYNSLRSRRAKRVIKLCSKLCTGGPEICIHRSHPWRGGWGEKLTQSLPLQCSSSAWLVQGFWLTPNHIICSISSHLCVFNTLPSYRKLYRGNKKCMSLSYMYEEQRDTMVMKVSLN